MERKRVLNRMNRKNISLSQLLEQQVKNIPDAIALIFDDEEVSYRELDQRANQFSHYLTSKGVKAEIPVGIFMDRSIEMVIAIWSVLKSGGVYVPLDLSLPESRLKYIIEETRMPFVVTKTEISEQLPDGTPCIEWDSEQEKFEHESTEPVEIQTNPENLAYIVYTSGSTGNPKGVMLPHRAFTRCAFWARQVFHFTRADRFLLNFFRAPEELFYPLFTGATVVLSPRNAERDMALLAQTVSYYKITVLGLTPSLLNAFIDEYAEETSPSLRHIFCAGEALPIEFQQRFFAHLNAKLYNFYGLAEAPYTSIWQCDPDDRRSIIPIGQPIDATVHILGNDLQPVQAQDIGEIYIGGPGLARGYLNMPELTADCFIKRNGTTLYRTGDRAYYDTEGQIIFLGRQDDQVQIRGLRVELGEIESVLRQLSSVEDVAVIFKNEQLIAYLTLKQDELINVEDWQAFVKAALPDYMLPSVYVILDELPLATTGKVNRKALPEPERRFITDLRKPALSEEDRRKILVDWNATRMEYREESCLHQLFESQAEKTPDAAAVFFGEHQFTYRELNQRANQLAHYLQDLGVKPDMLIGICVERSLAMLIGLLGILKAGAAYVPLDPKYPKERLGYILDDTKAPILITQNPLKTILPPNDATTVYLDTDASKIARKPQSDPHSSVNSQCLAYIIYTSGSSGRPKGVAIEHRNAVSLLSWAKSVFDERDLSGVLAATSFCFDLSVFEMFAPLSFGGSVILVENIFDAAQTKTGKPITLINTVPTAIVELLAGNQIPSTVRIVNLAGEPLQANVVDQLYRLETIERVYDLYGPSETTTYSTYIQRQAGGPVTIGRPISNTSIYILGTDMEPVPIGKTGAIYIGGHGVARGYLNRPDLTEQAFIRNPFTEGRLYQTGDLARYAPDGTIEFVGRKDQQIKLRGFRIELGEIESAIRQFPGVKQAVVIVRKEDPADSRLVAYLRGPPPPGRMPGTHQWCDRLCRQHRPGAPVSLGEDPARPCSPRRRADPAGAR